MKYIVVLLFLTSCSTCYESKVLLNTIECMEDVEFLKCEINRKFWQSCEFKGCNE